MDLVESGHLALAGVRFFVLDEADRLLDVEGQDKILKLHQRFPKAGAGTARLQVRCLQTLHPPGTHATTPNEVMAALQALPGLQPGSVQAGMWRAVPCAAPMNWLACWLDQRDVAPLPCWQVLMFSATLHSEDVKQFAARICRHPTLVDLKVCYSTSRHLSFCGSHQSSAHPTSVHPLSPAPA